MNKQLSKDDLRQIKTMWLSGQNWKMTAAEMKSLIALVEKHPSTGKNATTRIISAIDAELVERYNLKK